MTKAEKTRLEELVKSVGAAQKEINAMIDKAIQDRYRWNRDRVTWERLLDYNSRLEMVHSRLVFTLQVNQS